MNREPGATLASGFLLEYPIHSASAGRAEGHREGCAPACFYGRLPGSLSAPPEMPHQPQPAGPLPVCGCGRRAGGELALLCWPPPLLTARSSSAVRTHLPIAPWSWAGAGRPPSSVRSSHLHPPSSQTVPGFPPSQRGQQGAGCGGWTAWVQGTEVTPTPGSPGTEMAKPLTG